MQDCTLPNVEMVGKKSMGKVASKQLSLKRGEGREYLQRKGTMSSDGTDFQPLIKWCSAKLEYLIFFRGFGGGASA